MSRFPWWTSRCAIAPRSDGENERTTEVAFIYITHDLGTASIAQHGRIAIMYLGKVVETGNLNRILAEPRHPFRGSAVCCADPDPKIAGDKMCL